LGELAGRFGAAAFRYRESSEPMQPGPRSGANLHVLIAAAHRRIAAVRLFFTRFG